MVSRGGQTETKEATAQDTAESSTGTPDGGCWSAIDSARIYDIQRWGQGYFGINQSGHVTIHPEKDATRGIDLKTLVDELRERDIQLPVLLRFTDVLRHRVEEIHNAFQFAMEDQDYRGGYACVYPIKVNQQRHVVEEILKFGQPYGFGIEAGSKPELLAAMSVVTDDATPIICNGFKDDAFIEAVILAAKIGKNIIPVVEKFSELKLIIKFAELHNVRPSIGIRVKLAARGSGRWEQSGGGRSKFGLFGSEVLEALQYLRKHDKQDCLELLHLHIGSQVSNIRNIKNAIVELTRFYVELQRLGAGLRYIDVGGGLGVDYDGSKTNSDSSTNYSLQEYANDVVFHVKGVCDQTGVAHPKIISESGRAMVAYNSVLVFNVLGRTGFGEFELPTTLTQTEREQMPQPVGVLFDSYQELNESNFREYYHDALQARDETLHLFNLGYCSLEHRSLAERAFYGLCNKVLNIIQRMDEMPKDFAAIEPLLSDTFFCNWSIFQSLPDSWAIDQNFPIMPIHRLNEEPTARGILADITCDSDGRVDHFPHRRGTKRVLELHPINGSGEDYLLAAFLVGAYQEILGDMHNLFGDTNAVHVSLDERGRPAIDEVIKGDTVREVLQYVQYSADDLKRSMRKRVEKAVRDEKLTLAESRLLLKFYETGLEGYTYLE